MAYLGPFARVYDAFMADTPYGAWADYIGACLKGKQLVADLACGTGSITIPLAQRGFNMIGVDLSADMLSEAQAKAVAGGLDILFLAQDLRRLDLYGTIDGAVSACDGLNYLLAEADLFAAFSRCALFLNPGGLFIFDMNTEYKFREVLRDYTFTDAQGGASYVWKNYYDANTCINEYNVLITSAGRNFTETHYQRAYDIETVEGLLGAVGLRLRQVNDAYTNEPPKPDSVRVSFVAEK